MFVLKNSGIQQWLRFGMMNSISKFWIPYTVHIQHEFLTWNIYELHRQTKSKVEVYISLPYAQLFSENTNSFNFVQLNLKENGNKKWNEYRLKKIYC